MASIYQRGKKWIVYYRLPAKAGQKASQLTKTFASEKEAKLFENEQERLALEGRAARNSRLPLENLIRESLDAEKHLLKASTASLYDELLRVHIVPAIGFHPIGRIDEKLLSKYFASLLTDGRKDGKAGGLSKSRVNVIQTIIRKAMSKAVRWKYITDDPMLGIKHLSYEAPEMACLDPASLNKLLNASNNPSRRVIEQAGLSTQPIFAALVRFMAETGCRKGEALALQWSSVDLSKGQVTFKRAVTERNGKRSYDTPKNGERRTILIKDQEQLLRVLRSLHAYQAEAKFKLGKGYCQDDLVFCWPNGEALCGETFGHAFRSLVKRAGVPRIRLHDLRHTHASILINSGATYLEVSRRLGHKTVSITMNTYSHLYPGEGDRLSGTFAQAMGQVVKSPKTVVQSVVREAAG